MSVLNRQNNKPTTIAENAEVRLHQGAGNKAPEKLRDPALQGIASLAPVRKEKVLAVREQLAEGTYDLDERLDAVVECILTGPYRGWPLVLTVDLGAEQGIGR